MAFFFSPPPLTSFRTGHQQRGILQKPRPQPLPGFDQRIYHMKTLKTLRPCGHTVVVPIVTIGHAQTHIDIQISPLIILQVRGHVHAVSELSMKQTHLTKPSGSLTPVVIGI